MKRNNKMAGYLEMPQFEGGKTKLLAWKKLNNKDFKE